MKYQKKTKKLEPDQRCHVDMTQIIYYIHQKKSVCVYIYIYCPYLKTPGSVTVNLQKPTLSLLLSDSPPISPFQQTQNLISIYTYISYRVQDEKYCHTKLFFNNDNSKTLILTATASAAGHHSAPIHGGSVSIRRPGGDAGLDSLGSVDPCLLVFEATWP